MVDLQVELKMGMLVSEMALALADIQDEVRVTTSQREGCVVIEIVTAPSDIGKLIGKQGRTARSIRTILTGAAMKHQVRCELNIVEALRAADAAAPPPTEVPVG